MSYLTQMVGAERCRTSSARRRAWRSWSRSSAASRARPTSTLGNFWVDLTRSTLYILLPLSVVLALFLVSQGVVQTFSAAHHVALLQATKDAATGTTITDQVLAVGPVASQEAIKQLGTNGGGFFNANAAHPFENPTPLTQLPQHLALMVIPAALTYTFGKMVKDTRQGWAVLAAMFVIFLPLLYLCIDAGAGRQPGAGVAARRSRLRETVRRAERRQHGGQGGALRHRRTGLYATATTAVSCGAVNAMHDSFTPLGGLRPALAHPARRGRLRRRRRRPVRHAHVRRRRRSSSPG